jgi:recombination protein RecA
MKDEKNKALDSALKQLEELGISVPRLGDSKIEQMEVVASGSLGLDAALGVGGYPRDRKSTRLNSSHTT